MVELPTKNSGAYRFYGRRIPSYPATIRGRRGMFNPMKKLSVEAISTPIFSQGVDLAYFITSAIQKLYEAESGFSLEGKVLAVTSKVVSIAEGAVVSKKEISKRDLILREADHSFGTGGMGVELTIKHGLLIPSAGIDESNSENDEFILFPKDPFNSAKRLHADLSRVFQLKNFGVLITDSCPPPLRIGVIGVSLAHWGFKPTRSFINSKDLFGRELKMTRVNLVDSMAAMAVLAMGEANESCPLALIEGVELEFAPETSLREIAIPAEDDLYSPLFSGYPRSQT